jgi:hypothetical protein
MNVPLEMLEMLRRTVVLVVLMEVILGQTRQNKPLLRPNLP